jgi:hypothetical protein
MFAPSTTSPMAWTRRNPGRAAAGSSSARESGARMTVKRSGRRARGADSPPVRTSWSAYGRLVWRRERVAVERDSESLEKQSSPGQARSIEAEPRTAAIALETPGSRAPEREWNIWDLERRAREQAGDAERDQEWAALFMHLRQFANADGVLPTQFDGLVRESFSRLIQAA